MQMMGGPVGMILGGVQLMGTFMQANSQKQQGEAQQAQYNYVAAEERTQAGQEAAASQRTAQQQNLQNQYVQSRAQASAAAGGGSATDPTIETNAEQIAGQGRLKTLTDIYQGNSASYALNNKANLDQYQGTLANQAGNTKAMGTLFSGASSLYTRYGSPFSGGGDSSGGVYPTLDNSGSAGINWN